MSVDERRWKDDDDIWLVRYWGSVNLSEDDSADKYHVIPVSCETPEEAISAIRVMHDELAVFRSLRRVKGLTR